MRKTDIEKSDQAPLSLEEIVQKAGPSKIFVDVSAAVSDPGQVAEELARLVRAGAKIALYNVSPKFPESPLLKRLNSFREMFKEKDRFISLVDALEREQFKENVNLVHYSEGETGVKEAMRRVFPWTESRVIYIAGKPGSAVYGMKEMATIARAALLKKSLPELEIEYEEGYYRVSENKASLMMADLQLQSYVAFAEAA